MRPHRFVPFLTALLAIACVASPLAAQPANDICANAIAIPLGTTNGTLVDSENEATVACLPASIEPDVYYTVVATCDGLMQIDTCGTHDAPGVDLGMDTVISVHTDCADLDGTILGCNDDATSTQFGYCGAADDSFWRDSALLIPVQTGDTLIIRVAQYITSFPGVFQLNVACVPTCFPPTDLAGSYDCTTQTTTLNWTPDASHVSFDLERDGVVIASALPPTTNSFIDNAPAPGPREYALVPTCTNGEVGTTSVEVFVSGPTQNLILACEGLQGNVGGGLVDSAGALETALLALGQTVEYARLEDFDQQCFDLSATEVIWFMGGTYPENYRITPEEGDWLAARAAEGIDLYFEQGDHWGFLHPVSALDGRDGIPDDATCPGSIHDGSDSFTIVSGLAAPLAGLDLSGYVSLPYTQDALANESTDRLVAADLICSDTQLVSAEPIWFRPNIVPGYQTGVIAVHSDGGVMISCSFEFGGFGGEQQALAADYLSVLGGGVIQPPTSNFRRGDCNADAMLNIGDPISLLGILFSGEGPAACDDACDMNDDGSLNIADAIFVLATLFSMGAEPPAPGPDLCGADPTADGLDCASPPCP